MKRYWIEDAKCGETENFDEWAGTRENGIAAVKVNDGSGSKWLTVFATDDNDIVTLSDEDIYEYAKNNGVTEELNEIVDEHEISEYDGLYFDSFYQGTFRYIVNNLDHPAAMLVRYLFILVYCDPKSIDRLIRQGVGKYADELRIPLSEEESYYLDKMDIPPEKVQKYFE